MNGALLLGSQDGTNMEIASIVNEDDGMFLFGGAENEVFQIRDGSIQSNKVSDRLKNVIEEIKSGMFGPISEIIQNTLREIEQGGQHAPYLIGHDYESYMEAQQRVEKTWRDQDLWTHESIMNCVAIGCKGSFSTDSAIQKYPFF